MAKMRKVLQIATVLFILWAGIAFGQEVQPIPGVYVRQGEVAPADGAFFFQDSLVAIANALEELRQRRLEVINLEQQVKTLDLESEELKKVVTELKEANRALQLANDKADFMISNFQTILNLYKQALVDLRDDNKSLRNELWWQKVLGVIPIIGLIATAISGF